VKVGDLVVEKRLGDESKAWVVWKIKSDSHGIWIKIDEETIIGNDILYQASDFEVISKS